MKTFDQWWDNDPFPPHTIGKGGVRAACKEAWNAAIEAAAERVLQDRFQHASHVQARNSVVIGDGARAVADELRLLKTLPFEYRCECPSGGNSEPKS
jgi:hypothetical protein